MTEVAKFHILAHTMIAFIGAVLLIAIWYNIRKRFRKFLEEEEGQRRIDRALFFLSLALIAWVFSGLWTYFFFDTTKPIFQIGINLFSISNNVCMLFALFHFYNAPEFIQGISKKKTWIGGGIIAVALSSVLLILFGETEASFAGLKVSNLPDVVFSGILTYLLSLSFYTTFSKRGLPIVALIAVSSVLLMFISQLPEIFHFFNDAFTNNLVKIVAKTSLISIFLVLATSWIIQLANRPVPGEMSIQFMDWSLIKLNIPSKNILGATVDFGSKTTQFKNLLKFTVRRKYASTDQQSISIGTGGEIRNQTYLSRIVENINEILALKEEDKLERRDLFTFIGQSQYRLRMIPENIHLDETLIREFSESVDNEEYKIIVTNCNPLTNKHKEK